MQPPTWIWGSCGGEEGQEEEKELLSSPSATGEESDGQISTSKRVTCKIIHLKPSSGAVPGLNFTSHQQG